MKKIGGKWKQREIQKEDRERAMRDKIGRWQKREGEGTASQ